MELASVASNNFIQEMGELTVAARTHFIREICELATTRRINFKQGADNRCED